LSERNSDGAAGHFQFTKQTAKRMGLKVSKNNDERFDMDKSAYAAGNYMKKLDNFFSKETKLTATLTTTPVKDKYERKKFALAAFNKGEGRIARAQREAKKEGEDPAKWDDVKKYIVDAGGTEEQMEEVINYIDKILPYEQEFKKKSAANKSIKDKKPTKQKTQDTDCRWVTIDDRPVCIDN